VQIEEEKIMTIKLSRDQELATEQLRAIAPLIQLARRAYGALSLLPPTAEGTIEAAAWRCSTDMAKAVLLLEQDLERTISED
jgi:hypothetical protein